MPETLGNRTMIFHKLTGHVPKMTWGPHLPRAKIGLATASSGSFLAT